MRGTTAVFIMSSIAALCFSITPGFALTAEQAKIWLLNNCELIDHTQNCDRCHSILACNTSTLPQDYTIDFCQYLETHQLASQIVKKAFELGVTVEARVFNLNYQPLSQWVKLGCEETVRQDRIYWLKFGWTRNVPETVDWRIFDIEKWAAWSPTEVTSLVANGTTFTPASAELYWGVTYKDTYARSLEYQLEWINGTAIKAWAVIDNTTFLESDTDIDAVGSGSYEILFPPSAADFVYNISGVLLPPNFDTSNYGQPNNWDFYSASAGYFYDQDSHTGHQDDNVIGNYIIDYSSSVADGDYYVSLRAQSGGINASDDGEHWGECTAGGFWCPINRTFTVADGNLTIYVKDPVSGIYYFDGIMLRTQNNWDNLTFLINLSDYLNEDGIYMMRLRATNTTYSGVNDSFTVNFTMLINPLAPSCSLATATASHWLLNLTKYITPDPSLSTSGCILQKQWDNTTTFNLSWGATSGNWYNLTNTASLPFYGTHYLRAYCNDSTNQWVSCASDSYTIAETGGLTAAEHDWLMGLVNATPDTDIILGIFAFAGLCFAVAVIIHFFKGRNEILSFFSMLLFMLFLGMGVVSMSLGAAAVYTGWNNTGTWNSTGTGIPDVLVTLSTWNIWIFALFIVLGLIFWYMFWFKGVKL